MEIKVLISLIFSFTSEMKDLIQPSVSQPPRGEKPQNRADANHSSVEILRSSAKTPCPLLPGNLPAGGGPGVTAVPAQHRARLTVAESRGARVPPAEGR